MNKYLLKLKDSFKKRVVILGTVFAFLLFCWYMTVPIKIKNCDVGNIHYAHKFFNMCSDKILSIDQRVECIDIDDSYYHYPPDSLPIGQPPAYDITQRTLHKIYTRNNISGHISSLRTFYQSHYYCGVGAGSWVILLETIGHYDEAIDYVKSYPLEFQNYSVLNSVIKENCHNFITLGDVRRIGILGCKSGSRITASRTMRKFKEDLGEPQDLRQIWISKIEDRKNDKITIPNFAFSQRREKKLHLAHEAMDKGEYDLAYKYINEYNPENYGGYSRRYFTLYLKLGFAYMDKQDYKKAIKCFENILEIQDYNYKAHEKLEICYRKLGNTQKAEEHARIMKELLAL